MNRDTSRSKHWQLDGTHAILQAGGVSGVIDLHWPARGLTALCVQGDSIVGWLMGVGVEPSAGIAEAADAAWQPEDLYIRGSDLVAAYREPLEQPYNLQIYWRVIEGVGNDRFSIETIISVQTPTWEAYPCVTVSSAIGDREPTIVDDFLLFRGKSGWSYAEVTRPGDFMLTVPETAGGAFAGPPWRFGRQFMERGVIRRLQLRGAIVVADGAEQEAERLRDDLLAEEPSLAT